MNLDGTQLCRNCGDESSYTPCKSCANEDRAAREEAANAKLCPKCDNFIPNNKTPGAYPGAISRVDNITEICSSCGVDEAFADYIAHIKNENENEND